MKFEDIVKVAVLVSQTCPEEAGIDGRSMLGGLMIGLAVRNDDVLSAGLTKKAQELPITKEMTDEGNEVVSELLNLLRAEYGRLDH